MRAVANVPTSAVLIWAALAISWFVKDPNWAVIKTVLGGPFITLLLSLVFLALHMLAALVAIVAMKFGAPGQASALLAALLLALPFLKLSGDPELGNTMTLNWGLVIAAIVPWMFDQPPLWPWRLTD